MTAISWSGEGCLQRDLRYPGKRLRDRTARFRDFGALREPRRVQPWHRADDGNRTLDDADARLERDEAGGAPACASPCERAMEKQAAQAAAISSSGLVRPSGVSAREAQVTGSPPSVPLETCSIVPPPSNSDPAQVTFAVRSVAISLLPPSS